eukprot:gene10583-biopygen7776
MCSRQRWHFVALRRAGTVPAPLRKGQRRGWHAMPLRLCTDRSGKLMHLPEPGEGRILNRYLVFATMMATLHATRHHDGNTPRHKTP